MLGTSAFNLYSFLSEGFAIGTMLAFLILPIFEEGSKDMGLIQLVPLPPFWFTSVSTSSSDVPKAPSGLHRWTGSHLLPGSLQDGRTAGWLASALPDFETAAVITCSLALTLHPHYCLSNGFTLFLMVALCAFISLKT